jgi:hypothetical protein
LAPGVHADVIAIEPGLIGLPCHISPSPIQIRAVVIANISAIKPGLICPPRHIGLSSIQIRAVVIAGDTDIRVQMGAVVVAGRTNVRMDWPKVRIRVSHSRSLLMAARPRSRVCCGTPGRLRFSFRLLLRLLRLCVSQCRERNHRKYHHKQSFHFDYPFYP